MRAEGGRYAVDLMQFPAPAPTATLFAWHARRTGTPRIADGEVGLRTLIALLLTLAVAWIEAGAALLMLLTVVIIVASAALRLDLRLLGPMSLLAALGSLAVAVHHGGQLSLPAATPAQQLLGGLFFTWTLVKAVSTHLAGQAMRTELDRSHDQLSEALARVAELAERDELTGLPNRRRILDLLADAAGPAGARANGLALAMIDVDHFKHINDGHGHATGDDARAVADRLRRALESHNWGSVQAGLSVTVSIGVAVCDDDEPLQQLMQRADQCLYQAKRSGRNRVVHREEAAAAPTQPRVSTMCVAPSPADTCSQA